MSAPLRAGVRMSRMGLVKLEAVPEEAPYASAEVVIGLDFGSTFSGFAWALRSEPDKIHKFYDWPDLGAAGGKHYCKTKTCLWYRPGASPGSFYLQAWGYTAVVKYSAALQKHIATKGKNVLAVTKHENSPAGPIATVPSIRSNFSAANDRVSDSPMELEKDVGYFITLFKTLLAKHGPALSLQAKMPEGLTVERMISDFLREIGQLALTSLQSSLPGRHFTKADVQWCITVPGIWDEAAKQTMKRCMEIAGLVRGPACDAECASPFPVTVVLEPEAASVYCQLALQDTIQFNPGVKFLVVDVGGYTVDLLVHEKVIPGSNSNKNTNQFSSSSLSSSRSSRLGNPTLPTPHGSHSDAGRLKLREVAPGTGDYCGGSIVDERFIKFLRKKISGFNSIAKAFSESILKVMSHWEGIKYSFQGSEEFPFDLELPARLAKAWEDHDQLERVTPGAAGSRTRRKQLESESFYDSVTITVADMKNIFEPSVQKTLALIEQQISQVQDLQAIMVVGGFSASPYLNHRIREAFSNRVDSVVFPMEPGSAICCGAVVFGMQGLGVIASRFARKTYGISINRPFRPGDPPGLLMTNRSSGENTRSKTISDTKKKKRGRKPRATKSLADLQDMEPAPKYYCRDTFDVFSRIGDEVPNEYRVTRKYVALTDTHENTRIDLYSSTSSAPKYISPTDGSVKKEGTFVIHHPSKAQLGSRPSFLVSMYFGRTSIEVSCQGVNFCQSGSPSNTLAVSFEHFLG